MAGFDRRLKIEGLEETLRAFDKLGDDAAKELKKAVYGSLNDVKNTAIKKMQRERKSGRVYKRGKGRNLSPTHKASAPGEAPAVDTGSLVNSIKVMPVNDSLGYVGTKLDYGFWLEYGTKDLKLKERPWLRPSLEENREKIMERFRKALQRAIEAVK